jgi:hypothetical protein
LIGERHDEESVKVAKGKRGFQRIPTGEKGGLKDFLNVRLTALSDILRTWRSGPQGSLEKILRFFQKGG